MILSLRRRRTKSSAMNTATSTSDSDSDPMTELVVPTHFRCPISLDLMKDPVTIATGITYDRDSIEKWIESGSRTCPVTNQALLSFDQIPNHVIRRMIQDWCVQNRSSGVERIPTPRIPATAAEVEVVCERIAAAAARRDARRCLEMARKIRGWAKDSERDRKCIRKSPAGRVLASTFAAFCDLSEEASLLEEILSLLAWAVADEEALSALANDASLRRLVSFLRGNDLSARQNAALVIKELLVSSRHVAQSLARIEGCVEGLIGMIREPVCPRATKASLTAIFVMINTSATVPLKFLESGLVSLLLESAMDGERSVCERALRVLDAVCDSHAGREKVLENALTVPLVVKRILRVSDAVTEVSVSILWKILKVKSDGDAVVEALQVGALKKLMLVLQIGCGESLKGKVNELLKLFNLHGWRLDCDDSSDGFKYLKRPF